MRHREIRIKTLVLAALLSLGLAFVVFTLVTRSGSLVPRPPVLAGILLVVMGGLVLWMAAVALVDFVLQDIFGHTRAPLNRGPSQAPAQVTAAGAQRMVQRPATPGRTPRSNRE